MNKTSWPELEVGKGHTYTVTFRAMIGRDYSIIYSSISVTALSLYLAVAKVEKILREKYAYYEILEAIRMEEDEVKE